MLDVNFDEIIRLDEVGRRVRVQFITRNGNMDWIRITTFLDEGMKLRADYYEEEDPKTFEKIRKKEMKQEGQRRINLLNLNGGM